MKYVAEITIACALVASAYFIGRDSEVTSQKLEHLKEQKEVAFLQQTHKQELFNLELKIQQMEAKADETENKLNDDIDSGTLQLRPCSPLPTNRPAAAATNGGLQADDNRATAKAIIYEAQRCDEITAKLNLLQDYVRSAYAICGQKEK